MATVTISTPQTFVDLDLNFNIHPIRKDINVFINEYAITNSIKNLVLTNHYERPFNPVIGSNVRRMLFENVDTIIAGQLEKEIKDTIENFEPRASVIRVTAIPSSDENGYNITLEYMVVNLPNTLTISFFLERIR